MGIYGGAHASFDSMDYVTNSGLCMAKQLEELYGEAIYSEDLSFLVKEIKPLRVDKVTVNGRV